MSFFIKQLYSFSFSRYFKIVEIASNKSEICQEYISSNIFHFRLINKPFIKKFKFEKEYPNKLKLSFEEREPIGYLELIPNKYFFDEEGFLFDTYKINKFISINTKIIDYNQIKDLIIIIKHFKKYNYESYSIDFQKGYIFLFLDNIKIYLKYKDIITDIDIALNLIKYLKSKNCKFKEIDLRFTLNHIIVK